MDLKNKFEYNRDKRFNIFIYLSMYIFIFMYIYIFIILKKIGKNLCGIDIRVVRESLFRFIE